MHSLSLSSNSNKFLNKVWSWTGSHPVQCPVHCPGLTWYKSYSAWSFHRGWLKLDNWQALSPIPDTQIPNYQNLGTGAVTIITWATTPSHPQLLTMKECSSKEELIIKKTFDPIANKITRWTARSRTWGSSSSTWSRSLSTYHNF